MRRPSRCLRLLAVVLFPVCVGAARLSGAATPYSLYAPNSVTLSDRAAGIGKRVQPGGTLLLGNIPGPAIIRHLWMTNLGRQVEEVVAAGKVTIQFTWDDHGSPDLVVPLNEFFGRRFSASPEIAFHMVLGKNAYYPMPFQQSAKVEIKNHSDVELVGVYWQIDYEKVDRLPDDVAYFSATTRVPAPVPLDTAGRANARLEQSGMLPPRGTLAIAGLKGPAVIRRLQLSYDRKGGKEEVPTNRGVIVRIFWDGEPYPSVEVPLADFFGTGFGERRDFVSQAWTQEGARCAIHFPMPFARAAKIELVNFTDRPQGRFTWRVDYERKDGASLGADVEYFHACFRMSRPVPLNSTHLAMETTGRGKFVGLVWSCHWINAGEAPEGTQNFWVDGTRIQATGSEDYFGRAWGFGKEPLCFGYKGINLGPEKSVGETVPAWTRTTAYRAHVLDPIYFQKSLKLDLTCYGYNRGHRTDDYSTVCFWYQAEPHSPYVPLPPLEDLLPLDHPDSFGFGMRQIHELEAKGEYAAAIAKIEALVRAHPDNAKVGDLIYKKGCLREEQGLLGEAVRIFREIETSRRNPELTRDASDKLWLLERPGRMLLKAAAVSLADLYLDGKKLELPREAVAGVPSWGQSEIYRFTYPPMKVAWDQASSAAMRLPTLRVEAGVGSHLIAVRARVLPGEPIFTPKVGYFFADLDVVGRDIVTDASWKVAEAEVAGWEQSGFDDAQWQSATVHPLQDYPDGSWAWLWPRGFRVLPGNAERIWAETILPENKATRDTLFFRRQFEVPRRLSENR